MKDDFSIATVWLPSGGKIGISPLPGKSGDVHDDIRAISTWKADHVVSMTPAAEMVQGGAGDLGAALAAAGIAWEHLPIVDFGVPDAIIEALWPDLSERLHKTLDQAGSILLHCMGGKGRSGMIALRLLVERGEIPKEALSRIRSRRPGAVETETQFLWAVRAQTKPTTDFAR